MDLLVSHVTLGIVVGITGLCAGWWLHGRLPEKRSFIDNNDEGLIRELMTGLHSLSTRMVADVGEHRSAVGDVDRELGLVRDREDSNVAQLVDRLVMANRTVQAKLTEMLDQAIDAPMDDEARDVAAAKALDQARVSLGSRLQQIQELRESRNVSWLSMALLLLVVVGVVCASLCFGA